MCERKVGDDFRKTSGGRRAGGAWQHFSLVLTLKGFTSRDCLYRLGFQHTDATVLPFYVSANHHIMRCFSSCTFLLFLFLFFSACFNCTELGEAWNVKCHRPWTVWLGGAVQAHSPSNSPVHTTRESMCSTLAYRAILQSLYFLPDKHQTAF